MLVRSELEKTTPKLFIFLQKAWYGYTFKAFLCIWTNVVTLFVKTNAISPRNRDTLELDMSIVLDLVKTMLDPAEEVIDLEHNHRHFQMDILYQGRPDIEKYILIGWLFVKLGRLNWNPILKIGKKVCCFGRKGFKCLSRGHANAFEEIVALDKFADVGNYQV